MQLSDKLHTCTYVCKYVYMGIPSKYASQTQSSSTISNKELQ